MGSSGGGKEEGLVQLSGHQGGITRVKKKAVVNDRPFKHHQLPLLAAASKGRPNNNHVLVV